MNRGISRGVDQPSYIMNGSVLLATVEAVAPVAAFTFEDIPQQFRHLMIRMMGRCTIVATSDDVAMTFNQDGGANYDSEGYFANGGVGAFESLSAVKFQIGHVSGASSPVGHASILMWDILGYTNEQAFTGVIGRFEMSRTTSNIVNGHYNGHWRSTVPVIRIDLRPYGGSNWDVGSFAQLYGIV